MSKAQTVSQLLGKAGLAQTHLNVAVVVFILESPSSNKSLYPGFVMNWLHKFNLDFIVPVAI